MTRPTQFYLTTISREKLTTRNDAGINSCLPIFKKIFKSSPAKWVVDLRRSSLVNQPGLCSL
jgi:hypothetical protein